MHLRANPRESLQQQRNRWLLAIIWRGAGGGMRRSLAVRTKVDNLDGDLPATRSIGYLESRNCVLSMVSGSSGARFHINLCALVPGHFGLAGTHIASPGRRGFNGTGLTEWPARRAGGPPAPAAAAGSLPCQMVPNGEGPADSGSRCCRAIGRRNGRQRPKLHLPAPSLGRAFPNHWFHGIVRNLEDCAVRPVPLRSIRV